jgi:hypothetical protein
MAVSEPVYDRIGGGYAGGRCADPRIAAALAAALGDADRVLNVGAGTASYEPGDRLVIAVDPSPVMLAQRPAGSAPCVLDPAIWRATSALSLIPASDRAAGMARLSADLASGRWHQRYGHLLALDELDLGYCVIIARP